jgi:hypothetical protein
VRITQQYLARNQEAATVFFKICSLIKEQQLIGITRGTQAEFSARPLEIGSGDAFQTKLDGVA